MRVAGAASMLQDLALYAELLIFLLGTFMYGFLTRELFQQRAILPGNRPIRLLALGLTLWYSGSLLDELASILLSSAGLWSDVGPFVDVARSVGWLASFPLLAHTIWRMLDPRPSWLWIAPAYLSLLAFPPVIVDVIRQSETDLTRVSRDVYELFLLHVTLATIISVGLILYGRRKAKRPELAQFLRWLMVTVLVVEALVLLGATLIDVWSEPVWRILVNTSGLVLGMTFLYFVRRYNLLSLSLSNRSLRHFVSILALLFLILLAGPALGASGHPVFHRVLAWGILLAVLAGLFFGPLTRWATRRSQVLARLWERTIGQEEIAALSEQLQKLDASEAEITKLASDEVSRWIGAETRWSDNTEIWSYFREQGTKAFNRLRAPSPPLANALVEEKLHAVFPLRVGGELESVFAIASSAVGGGYEDGEMESIQLVLSQLAAAIEIRRLLDARLAAERSQAEQERLSMLGMVSASLAHELKNPLSSMKALAQTVREELGKEETHHEQAEDLRLIVEQVDRLNEVAREVLGFARPGTHSDTTPLEKVIESAAYVLDHEARGRGITIDQEAVENGAEARGTPATWQTVVFNLMLNAIRHAPDGSTVRVRLRVEDDALVFECANEGPPIAEDIAAHLFDPFVSGEGGTGLGLALVEQRVRELGGRIDLVNEPDNILFRVRI
ncbi:MAG: HAMP domain-containing histidine kinase [Acidobacteria bacterium]|nr:MAG: HAMP domain-containing histidine kinase [Acidobacteriota bacterium]